MFVVNYILLLCVISLLYNYVIGQNFEYFYLISTPTQLPTQQYNYEDNLWSSFYTNGHPRETFQTVPPPVYQYYPESNINQINGYENNAKTVNINTPTRKSMFSQSRTQQSGFAYYTQIGNTARSNVYFITGADSQRLPQLQQMDSRTLNKIENQNMKTARTLASNLVDPVDNNEKESELGSNTFHNFQSNEIINVVNSIIENHGKMIEVEDTTKSDYNQNLQSTTQSTTNPSSQSSNLTTNESNKEHLTTLSAKFGNIEATVTNTPQNVETTTNTISDSDANNTDSTLPQSTTSTTESILSSTTSTNQTL